MKLILSRKGFDSVYGGCASPIFGDGSMVSLPIPLLGAPHRLVDATRDNINFATSDVLADLTRRRARANRLNEDLVVHLDPYLRRHDSDAASDWRAAFGQDGSAQGHLREQGVGRGDLFLFFGWFRSVHLYQQRWRYAPGSPDLHVLFGWLEVGEVLCVDGAANLPQELAWLADHPHWRDRANMGAQNTIYIAAKRLSIGDLGEAPPGGGVFNTFSNILQLTEPGSGRRSTWRLPRWFHPSKQGAPHLSHHGDARRWELCADHSQFTRLKTVGIGQEFVIDLNGNHGAAANSWLRSIFESALLRTCASR